MWKINGKCYVLTNKGSEEMKPIVKYCMNYIEKNKLRFWRDIELFSLLQELNLVKEGDDNAVI